MSQNGRETGAMDLPHPGYQGAGACGGAMVRMSDPNDGAFNGPAAHGSGRRGRSAGHAQAGHGRAGNPQAGYAPASNGQAGYAPAGYVPDGYGPAGPRLALRDGTLPA